MGKLKEIQLLENSMFDVIESMHKSLVYKKLDNYRLGLAVLEQLNDDYCELTGQYYIAPMKALDYHSRQWTAF